MIGWVYNDIQTTFPASSNQITFSTPFPSPYQNSRRRRRRRRMPNYSHPHICHCLTRLSTLPPNSPLTISPHRPRPKTAPDFVDAVFALAQALLTLGIGSGDVIAVAALNSELYLEWFLAIAFVGGIVAPLNYRWSFEEALLAVEAVRPVMLVTDESCKLWSSKLQNYDFPFLRWHVSLESSDSELSNSKNTLTTETLRKNLVKDSSLNYSWAPDGAVLICFTSGTTGRPKGVIISHLNLIVQSLAKIAIVGYSEDDVYLHTAPLCHIGGLSSAISMLLVGACHVFMPKFEAKLALEVIQQYNVTSLITVPAMMADLSSSTRGKDNWKGVESVKKILNGGGGLSIALTKEAVKLFPRAKLLSAYEACSSLTFMTLHDPTVHKTVDISKTIPAHKQQGVCVGKPAPHIEVKIHSEGSSHVGKILTRGSHVMLRYWDQSPKNSSSSINQDWLDTGDIGYIDEYGNLWLIGRTKGRIKSGGENIYPEEVEAVLSQHIGVQGVVTVGIPDTRLTEMVVACIQVRRDWHWSNGSFEHSTGTQKQFISHEILQQHCRERNLARFKIPKKFMHWNKPFPLTTTGKVIREQVKQEVMSQLRSLNSNF
ncbi:2-succinylbenzoate--CoA ligase, chloroplastic/peroxisomal isoform X2 [Cannabis sativa]|uniref:2-succinylbenzoate--CoA ligase, chloroplastic/peroxisomal isoform X2 n=1 Tax=Cannabis sativa TaxID=3483 RepID=UPI0029CA28D5|nr:2-succinylbenzoate--CoA ligase, chloroplastic/peroxisomal isoform X2 [Cannabis sativa]